MKDDPYWKEGNEHNNIRINPDDQESLFLTFKNGTYMCDLLDTIDENSGILRKAVNRG